MSSGSIFILSGPSGVGKNAIEKKLRKLKPELEEITTYTTREPRPQEEDGIHYHFVTQTRFKRMIDEHAFLEWAVVHDHLYGTPKAAVEEPLAQGKDILLIIDVQGALNIKKVLPEAYLIFIEPENTEQLAHHLKKRKKMDKADLELRLENAEKELAMRDFYDFSVINKEGKLHETAKKVAKIMEEVEFLDKK